jgi:hypothetical protein
MAQNFASPAIASPHLFSALIDRVDRVLRRNVAPVSSPEHAEPAPAPDPVLTPDAGQFIRVELLDHVQQCSDESCYNDTRIAVSTHEDVTGEPYCSAHAHVLFADWMVGA